MKSRTGPLLTKSSSGSIGIGELLRTASSIPPKVCSPDKQVGKHTNTVNAIVPHVYGGQSGTEGTVALLGCPLILDPLGAWQWKAEAPSPKWETLTKVRFWTAMGHTYPKHGASMDLGGLRQRLAWPLTEVKSTEPGKVDVVNIEVSGKMVKMLCAP